MIELLVVYLVLIICFWQINKRLNALEQENKKKLEDLQRKITLAKQSLDNEQKVLVTRVPAEERQKNEVPQN